MSARERVDAHPYAAEPHYWLGRLSTTAALAQSALPQNAVTAREELRDVLAQFLVSPVPSEELRNTIRKELR